MSSIFTDSGGEHDDVFALVPDQKRHVDRDLTRVWCRQVQQEFVLLWDSELCPYCGREV